MLTSVFVRTFAQLLPGYEKWWPVHGPFGDSYSNNHCFCHQLSGVAGWGRMRRSPQRLSCQRNYFAFLLTVEEMLLGSRFGNRHFTYELLQINLFIYLNTFVSVFVLSSVLFVCVCGGGDQKSTSSIFLYWAPPNFLRFLLNINCFIIKCII